jgi:hypothetical protein
MGTVLVVLLVVGVVIGVLAASVIMAFGAVVLGGWLGEKLNARADRRQYERARRAQR